MSKLSPMDVFDNPITTEGYVSSDWGLPGEDPDESFADEGRVGEVAGPNYLLEESQAGVTEQVRQSLNEEDSAFGGYDSAFGGYDELLGATPTMSYGAAFGDVHMGADPWDQFGNVPPNAVHTVREGWKTRPPGLSDAAWTDVIQGAGGASMGPVPDLPWVHRRGQVPDLPYGWRRHFTAPKVAIGLLGLSLLGTLAVMVSDHDEP